MLWICRHNKNVDKNRKIKYKKNTMLWTCRP